MQTANHGDLAKRTRYYQAATDIDTTPKGSEYKDLRQNYVVFICTFDPFGQGRPIYRFQNYCILYDKPIPLKDGTEKIFLNTACKDTGGLDDELSLFYDYVGKKTAQTDFTRELDSSISRLKQEQEERSMYLTYTSRMMECRQDGYQEGLHTGLATGREEGISIGLERGLERGRLEGLERGAHQTKLETARTLLSMGLSPEQVAQGTSLPLETVRQLARSEE